MLPKLQTQSIKPRTHGVRGAGAPVTKSTPIPPKRTSLQPKLVLNRGFVLLEIVIALGLFSLVAVSLTQALDQVAKTSKIARDESRVMRVLESVLAQVAHRPELEEGSDDFKSTADGVEASARIKKIKLLTRNKAELEKMYSIQVTAWITDGLKGKLLERSMETYVYSPQSKD
jgi:type II secretory pathway pseudopilin PulG